MAEFWKLTALVLVTVLLGLALRKQERDFTVLLSLAACAMAAVVCVEFLTPVLDILRELEGLGSLQEGVLDVLMKAVGIALVTEISTAVCADAGNASLGKLLQMAGSAAVLYLSIPIFRGFLRFVQEILGKL